jgi:hypothetical protein
LTVYAVGLHWQRISFPLLAGNILRSVVARRPLDLRYVFTKEDRFGLAFALIVTVSCFRVLTVLILYNLYVLSLFNPIGFV